MTLGNRGNTHGFHEFQFHDFSPSNKFKLQFLPYSCRFTYLTFANTSKHGQNDEIRHSSFRSSKPHEVKFTDMRCILTTNINICRGENTTSRRISRRWTRSGTNLVIFSGALCAQTNLFWREMKIKKMYLKSNTRQENFRIFEERDILIGCVPFGESKNGFLILDLPDFAVERNVKSEIGFVTLVTFRQRVQYARQPLKK